MRIGVGSIELESVGHLLGRLELQGVIGGDAFGSPVVRVWIETGIGGSQSRVSVGDREGPNCGLHLLRKQRARRIGIKKATARRRKIGGLETIAVSLAIDGITWCGNTGLVEGNRYGLVHSVIPDVRERQYQVIFRLPLEVETPVFRIRELVLGVVAAEQKVGIGEAGRRTGRCDRLGATAQLRLIVDERRYLAQVARRGCQRSCSKGALRGAQPSGARSVKRHRERPLPGGADRTASPQPTPRGKSRTPFTPTRLH